MQAGKNMAASAKETAANIAAAAHAGMEKTKATAHEKAERMTTRDPAKKAMAAERKQQLVEQAEINKLQARQENAAEREEALAGGFGLGSTPPGYGAGQPAAGSATAAESRPVLK